MSQVHTPSQVSRRLYVGLASVSAVFAAITIFTRLEDGAIALAVWGGYLVALGVVLSVVLLSLGRPARWWTWWIGSVFTAIAVGVFALVFASSASVALLTWSIAVWSVLAGATSIVQGLRLEKGSPIRSDWTTIGGGTLFLGLLVVIVPPEVYWLMGLAGVWAAMMTVFVIIAALSARSAEADKNGGMEAAS